MKFWDALEFVVLNAIVKESCESKYTDVRAKCQEFMCLILDMHQHKERKQPWWDLVCKAVEHGIKDAADVCCCFFSL